MYSTSWRKLSEADWMQRMGHIRGGLATEAKFPKLVSTPEVFRIHFSALQIPVPCVATSLRVTWDLESENQDGQSHVILMYKPEDITLLYNWTDNH